MNIEKETKERLLNYGIKPSLHRMAIMDYLIKYKTHPTVDTIYNDLSPSIPTLSKTTVYNTLKILTDQGAILSLNIDEKNVRYDGDISNHGHFRCKICDNVYDFTPEEVFALNIKSHGDFQVTECHVYYKGYCKACNGKISL